MVSKQGVMLQGTSSHVGKSVLCAALCRIFNQDGYTVAPFKAQNMALNSMVTPEGGEIGRAQGVQAEAAGVLPSVDMNPILVKPKKDMHAQVIVRGTPLADMSASEYRQDYLPRAGEVVQKSLHELRSNYQVLVIEGAGSPAEINLKDNEIANMRTAYWAGVPVLLVADIDRGGVFASLIGTLELLDPWERDLVQGFIINKFRGDLELLKPGLKYLEERTGKPVLGVVPYLFDHGIEEEDSVFLQDRASWGPEDAPLKIAVLQFPRISNFTDLNPLLSLPDTNVRLTKKGEKIGAVDAVILPGTKNTIADLDYLKEEGYEEEIIQLVEKGVHVIGICGGYQMLGRNLRDPGENENTGENREGLGLLNCSTTFFPEKATHEVEARINTREGWLGHLNGEIIKGYEIHMGHSEFLVEKEPLVHITMRSGQKVNVNDGLMAAGGRVLGTHLHDFFANRNVLVAFANALRQEKGLPLISAEDVYFRSREEVYDQSAASVREALDMDKLYKIMGLSQEEYLWS